MDEEVEEVRVDAANNVERVDVDFSESDGDIHAMFHAMRKKANNQVSHVDIDEESADTVLREYFAAKLEDNNLKFWEKFQKKDGKYSRALARLAKKYLTPPPTSTCVERLFSTASNIIDDRPRLLPDNLEKLLFLRENLTKKNIDIDY